MTMWLSVRYVIVTKTTMQHIRVYFNPCRFRIKLGVMLAWILLEGLPKCQNKSVILVVVDRFTKYAHFIAMAHPFTAVTVAELFWK